MYSYKDITKLNQYNTAPMERKEKYCRDWSSYILGLCQVLGKQLKVLIIGILEEIDSFIRQGYRLTKVNFVHVYPQLPMLWSNIRLLVY